MIQNGMLKVNRDNHEWTGTITGLRDYGTIVILFFDADEGQVPMDHRAFRGLLEGEECGPNDLIGRDITFDGELLTFID